MKILKALISVFIISLVLFILVLLVFNYKDHFKNNKELELFTENIVNYPLPNDTDLIGVLKEIRLQGNGNHCDFLVKLELLTNLSEEEITEYYSTIGFPPVRSDYQGNEDSNASGIHEPITPIINYYEIDHYVWEADVILEIYDFGYPPNLDYRCH